MDPLPFPDGLSQVVQGGRVTLDKNEVLVVDPKPRTLELVSE